ncbi:DUF3124 domain-containing protein [Pantanalinema sp. GBBB05]|uniref:DUF3124 domain-containing protein n=1 Tax=Pantanalinema sp. GBBB05 TaxID=2604139 RepID=UPI001D258CBF|nr:DUF3124 domain-containing protein [Pantanalinema sp. GBBB05]
MKRVLSCFCLVLVTACTTSKSPTNVIAPLKPITLDQKLKIIAGQTVYVPIYSHIFMWDQSRTMDLTATLSVRNTDLTQSIIIASVNYYNNRGQLVRKYLQQPVELGALSSTDFVVNQDDSSGGSGAAFVVEWVSQYNVAIPVIESVMINTSGNQGVSFVSAGRVIKQRANPNNPLQ